MTHHFASRAGTKPAPKTRRWIVLAAGLVALCLQVMAQVMPADAMQNAMRVAALTADEMQSFAGTCLGFGSPSDEQSDERPAKPGIHASCPVCFTLAQTHGFAPAPVALPARTVWGLPTETGNPADHPAQSLIAAAFASRAPPAASIA
jgi:peptidoglycan/LPS O-acetylase OafA/YrhL